MNEPTFLKIVEESMFHRVVGGSVYIYSKKKFAAPARLFGFYANIVTYTSWINIISGSLIQVPRASSLLQNCEQI